jgi:hypothetical protein
MGIGKLIRDYESLAPSEQALFAAAVRAHQIFNSSMWREEIARRHEVMEMGQAKKIDEVEQLVNPTGLPRGNPSRAGS